MSNHNFKNVDYLIDFFESLKFDKVMSNLEFSTNNEQLHITKGIKAYLFYFSKVPDIFRSNLCKEIMLITEDDAHLKLDFNNSLAKYFELKIQGKSVENFFESQPIDCPENFIYKFEKQLTSYPNFNYHYLKLAIKGSENEQKEIIKKAKI